VLLIKAATGKEKTGVKVLPVMVVTSTNPTAPTNKPVPPMIVPG